MKNDSSVMLVTTHFEAMDSLNYNALKCSPTFAVVLGIIEAKDQSIGLKHVEQHINV